MLKYIWVEVKVLVQEKKEGQYKFLMIINLNHFITMI